VLENDLRKMLRMPETDSEPEKDEEETEEVEENALSE
jgi:hypothetical protein